MNQRTAGYLAQSSSRFSFGPKTILMGAGALIVYGLTRRSKPGVALATAGGVLAFRAAKAQSASSQNSKAIFLINTSPEKAYELWRNFENLPSFMAHLKSVRVLEDGRSEWVAVGPMDREVRWNAEVTEDRANEHFMAVFAELNRPDQRLGKFPPGSAEPRDVCDSRG